MSEYVQVNALGAVNPSSELKTLLNRAGGERAVKRLLQTQAVKLESVIRDVRRSKGNPKTVRLYGKTYPITATHRSSWEALLLTTLAIAQKYPVEFGATLAKKVLFGDASTNIASVAGMVKDVAPIVTTLMDVLLQVVHGANAPAPKIPSPTMPSPQVPTATAASSNKIPMIIGGITVVGITASVLLKKKKG